jgi:pimeloyl-ACP methyl ester carboxylesterase
VAHGERVWLRPIRRLDDGARAALVLVADVQQPVDVVGHSMGGRVALEVWRLAPGRVRSLVLLDTGVDDVRAGEAESRQVLVDLARNVGMGALADAWLPQMVHPDRRSDNELMTQLREMVLRATPEQHGRRSNVRTRSPRSCAIGSTNSAGCRRDRTECANRGHAIAGSRATATRPARPGSERR